MPARRRPILPLASVLVLGGVVLVIGCRTRPDHPPVEPAQPERLSPQLAAYLPRFVDAVGKAPESADAHARLGLVYEANEMWPEARLCFEGAATLDAKEPLASYHVALAAFAMRDEAAAEAALRQAIERDPGFAPALHRLCVVDLDRGDFADAERLLVDALKRHPNEPLISKAFGDLLLRRGEPAAALPHLEQAARLDPRNGTVRHLLGTAYRELGRAEDAEREFSNVKGDGDLYILDEWSKRLAPHAMSLARQMANATALTNAGRPEEAAVILEETLRWHPEEPGVLDNLAIAYMSAGDLSKADTYLRRALAADPAHAMTHVGLSALAARRSNLQSALMSATRAVELAPGLAEAHRQRASVLRQLERPEEALASASIARNLAPDAASSHLHVARALADLGRNDEAVAEFRAALEIDPALPGAHFGLVEALSASGHRDEARAALATASSALPGHPLILDLAARHADLVAAR